MKKRKNKQKQQNQVVVAPQLKGKGDFTSVMKKINQIASYVRPAVSTAAKVFRAGKDVAELFGVGDYRVSKNTIVAGGAVPTFGNQGRGGASGVRICNREFIQDVSGTVAFFNQTFSINPGVRATFPWLASVADSFEQYKIHGLVFEYRPTSGMVTGTSTALGTVVLSTQYDVFDTPFTSKQSAEAYEFAVSIVPYSSAMHCIECDPKENVTGVLYVRTTDLTSGANAQLYDMGNLNLITVGMPTNATLVGELWVSYDVEFFKPKISGFGGPSYCWFASSAPVGAGGPLGNAQPQLGPFPGGLVSNLANMCNIVSNTTFEVPSVGYYIVYVTWQGTGSVTGAVVTTGGSNIGDTHYFFNGGTGAYLSSQLPTATNNAYSFAFSFQVSSTAIGPTNQVTLTGLAGLAGAEFDFKIFPVSS